MHINFRLRPKKDKELISYIEKISKKYNTNNRTEIIRKIIEEAKSKEKLEIYIEKILEEQQDIKNKLENLSSTEKTNESNKVNFQIIEEDDSEEINLAPEEKELVANMLENPIT